MGQINGVPGWIYTLFFIILYLTGETYSAARFLSHVPREDYSPDTLDRDLPDYDADVKLPGRHYPKLPYQNPYLENDQDDFRSDYFSHQSYYQNNHNLHHGSNFHNSNNKHQHQHNANQNYHQDQAYGQQTPVMAYGVRRDPYGSTFSRESQFQNNMGVMSDYLDDTGKEARDGKGGFHRLGSPQGTHKKINAPSTTPLPPSPSFARNNARSITVQAGKTALLVCGVVNVGDKSVSWMRHEDLHILTVDKYKYSTDSRLAVNFNEAEQQWVLKIQPVTEEDAGLYECQVSTKPVLSYIVSVNVIVPSARIINGPEIFVHRGSLINLTCVVDHTVERPLYIFWYHFNKMIDYDDAGDTVVVTQSGPNTISNLLVKDASQADSGKYTCRPSNGEDASVMLHVLNGEHPAAMQTNTSDRIMNSLRTMLTAVSVCISAVILLCRC